MQSSLCRHIYFDKKSAEVYVGGSVKPLGRHSWFNLATLHAFETKNLKDELHTNIWFNSPEAMHEPIVVHSDEDLFILLFHIFKKVPIKSVTDAMRDSFFGILSERDALLESPSRANGTILKDRTVGTLVEALRLFIKLYPDWMDDLYISVEKLSKLRFFKLWK